jgi:hypothetical protein
MSTVPVFAPNGSLGDIPVEKLHEAIAAGAKPGVSIKAPDGTPGVVPADRYQEAAKAGATIVPFHEQETQHPGFWGAVKSYFSPGPDDALTSFQQWQKVAAGPMWTGPKLPTSQENSQRKAQGLGPTYRALVPIAEGLGMNVKGAEQAASQGDVGGVAGYAAVPAAAAVAPLAAEGATTAAKKVLGPAAQDAAARMYQSTLKPSLAKNAPDPARLVQTGLQNEIPVSQAGADKLSTLITDLNDKISKTIASDPTKTVNKFDVTARLGDTAKKFATQVNPDADLKAIGESGNEFLKNQPAQIPVQTAQDLKVGTYRQLKSRAYGELGSATIESQKALARGLKEELVTQFPELKDLNAQDSKLINLDGALEHAVRRIDNHQLVSFGATAAAGAGGVAAGAPGAAIAGILKTVVDNPTVKSKLAIALNKIASPGGRIPMGEALKRVGLYSAALSNAQANADQGNQP